MIKINSRHFIFIQVAELCSNKQNAMWIVYTSGIIAALLFIANKLLNKWLNVPGADFNKQYDKTIL